MIWFEDFFGYHYKEFFGSAIYMGSKNHVIEHAHHLDNWVKVSPFVAMCFGFILSWLFYIKYPSWPLRLANTFQPLHALLYNKYYFDEAYNFMVNEKKYTKSDESDYSTYTHLSSWGNHYKSWATTKNFRKLNLI